MFFFRLRETDASVLQEEELINLFRTHIIPSDQPGMLLRYSEIMPERYQQAVRVGARKSLCCQ